MSDRRRQAKHRAPPLLETAGAVPYPKPAMRKLRVYAFDPQASNELATSTVNDAVIGIPWEESWERPLTPGPCGEYLEVIDHDPASGLVYAPDLTKQPPVDEVTDETRNGGLVQAGRRGDVGTRAGRVLSRRSMCRWWT